MGNSCGGKKDVKLVLIGLDLSGKTSILNRLRSGEAGTTTPTVGFNFETIPHKKATISIWDTGGQDKIRDLWKHYYEEVDGVFYVVDSTDEARMEEAKDALHKALHDLNLQSAFLCVVANKRDLVDRCLPAEDIKSKLNLNSLPASRSWTLVEASALQGTGLNHALDWAVKQTK